MAPSPISATTGRSGWANFAPIAYGTPAPIVASVPDRDPRIPRRIRSTLAYQLATDPESAVTIASSGRTCDISHTIRIGFTGSASTMLCRSTVSHQAATFSSILSRHSRSERGARSGRSARNVAPASATMLSSVG